MVLKYLNNSLEDTSPLEKLIAIYYASIFFQCVDIYHLSLCATASAEASKLEYSECALIISVLYVNRCHVPLFNFHFV